ncbi:NAD(P)-dependent oxidoreductase [Gluconobacter sp. Dm-73]|uniref:NAD-dependent epimerase/dehydratase family protein n=1 Tax=Gluconobacter sp. Dm-73 TaxID=2799802 RepID=UPI001B8C686C|nr:NAD(P)-dependent oxidoreductase [Gluconobacter sp. Dm-73]MBS1073293.1 NAD(P)-dependent oxidoreductase [Gluconobacter sp. Dm-73]
MKILLAGASGAVGRPLIARLVKAGHEVWGMVRRAENASIIQELGAWPVVGNALDRAEMFALLERVRPEAVIDQLTSLPSSPFDLAQRLPADRVLRLEGGGNLHDAARAVGVRRYVQQSCGFYLNGEGVLATEDSRLRTEAPGGIGESARMYEALERRVLGDGVMDGVALRYGFFYGPRTWYWPDGAFSLHVRKGEVPVIGGGRGMFSFIHVDDAAQATVAALAAPAGFYNVVDDQPTALSRWLPAYAAWVGADAPPHVDEADTVRHGGEESVYYQNSLSGACNRKAKALLGLEPARVPWVGV